MADPNRSIAQPGVEPFIGRVTCPWRTRLTGQLLFMVLAGGAADAQTPLPIALDSGAVVRIRLADKTVFSGKLVQALHPEDPEIWYCAYPGPPCPPKESRELKLNRVAGLDLRTGNKAVQGALVGGGIAAGVLALGALVWSDDEGGREEKPVLQAFTVLTIVAIPATIGAWIGSGKNRWRPVLGPP